MEEGAKKWDRKTGAYIVILSGVEKFRIFEKLSLFVQFALLSAPRLTIVLQILHGIRCDPYTLNDARNQLF
jgi:hypothetical protein